MVCFAGTHESCVTWPLLLTTIPDSVFQLTKVMEHDRVVANTRDEYTETPFGLVSEGTH